MSSDFSSTKAYRSLIKSTSQSLPENASEASSSTRKHSIASQYSSKSSSKASPKPSSKVLAKSSSKTPSKTSSKHSPKSSHKHKSNFTLPEISTNGRSHEDSTHPTYPMIERYVDSPTLSNTRYTSSTNTMTQADYQARMQAILDSIDTQLDLNGTQVDFYCNQKDHYDTQLDLSGDECEEY